MSVMNIGMGVCSIMHKDGQYKQYDGIGHYTFNLMNELKKIQALQLQLVYFNPRVDIIKKILTKASADLQVYQSVFLQDVVPGFSYRKLEEKINLFHSTDHIIPKLKHTPVIATIHDASLFKETNYKKTYIRKLKNALLKKHAQYANHVITGSHYTVPDLVEYWGIDPSKISVIYDGIDDVWFESIENETKLATLKKYNLNKKFILAVGTLCLKKNTARIITAYLQLPQSYRQEYDLVIVGKVGWECDALVAQIRQEQSKGNVKWLNYLEFNELRAIYQSASLLAFVSLDEGFGLPILEGFASRIPVLTSNVTAMPEIAGDAATLVDPTSVEAISAAMQTQLDNPSAVKIEHAVARARQFSWQKNAQEVMNLYQKWT